MYTKQQIAALHAKLDAALKEFAEENGLVAGASKILYGSTDFKVTVNFGDKTANPNEIDPIYLRDLRLKGFRYGLDESMLNKEVVLPTSKGLVKCKFVGLKNSKAGVLINGKVMLYPAESLARYMKNPIA
jgi:hypothetical protein